MFCSAGVCGISFIIFVLLMWEVFTSALSLLKFPGFFLVFWPISTMLQFGWCSLVLLFPSPQVLVPILWWLYWAPQLPTSGFYCFFISLNILSSLFAFLQLYLMVSLNGEVHYSAGSLFCWLSLGLVSFSWTDSEWCIYICVFAIWM